jgi:hypothetical protein
MIRTNKILALGFGLVSMLFISSCVDDDDFSTPDLTIAPVDVSALGEFTSFSGIVARYEAAVANGDQVGVFSVENDDPLYTIGYVVSDDGKGNFFEEIVIQNSIDGNDPATDVRRGLKVEINARDLGGFYNFGRKVYIKLNGLAISESNGVFALGKSNGNSSVQIEDAEFQNFIIRDPETASITPKTAAVGDLTDLDENTFIKLENSQIVKVQKDLTFAGEATDEFDGFRSIINCDTEATISLQTSTFADFKGVQLPQGRGAISGLYSRDFGDDFSVLIINDLSDINFEDSNRCDPVVLECTGTTGDMTTIFEEDFESFGGYVAEGWTMTNVEGGSTDWFISSFSGNNYSRVSAFNSNQTANVWLVTPDIDLDATDGEQFSFDVQANYDNGTNLTVLVSQDFTGDVTAATWIQIDANIPSGPSGGFGDFETVGPLNVSCLEGSVNFAFLYAGSDPAATTRYHVDNVEVAGN